MKLPLLDDLIHEQLDIYDADPETPLFVLGPPGSGKTSLAVLRMQLLRSLGHSCLLITKNRLLASLGSQLGNQALNVTTMHSFISSDHSQRIGCFAPEPYGPFIYDWPTLLSNYERANIEPQWDHLVIDEGQNLPAGFFAWAVRYGAKTVSVFANEDQTTDSQRASIEDILAAPMPDPIRLSANHRNTREIAALAEHFHRSSTLPPAVVKRPRSGDMPRLVTFTQWSDAISSIANRLTNRGGSIGVIVYPVSKAQAVHQMLKSALPPETRVDLYTHRMPKGAEQNIHPMKAGITVLTGESAIGLEFDSVYLQDLSRSLPSIDKDQCRRMYMLCARARDSLILLNEPSPLTTAQLSSLPDSTLLSR